MCSYTKWVLWSQCQIIVLRLKYSASRVVNFPVNFELLIFPLSENGSPPYWNFTSGFDFDLFIVMDISVLHRRTKFHPNQSTHGGVMTSYRFFKMAAIDSEIYFRFRFLMRHLLRNVEIYVHTKFRWYIVVVRAKPRMWPNLQKSLFSINR